MYQLSVQSAVLDPFDHVFRITLDDADGRVFDMVVSKESFDYISNDTTLVSAKLVDLEFNKHSGGGWWFTAHMRVANSSNLDKVDFEIECDEPPNCGVMFWEVNDSLWTQACWG